MKILIDVDSILAAFLEGIGRIYALETSEDYEFDAVTDFYALAAGARSHPDLPQAIFHRPGFFRALQVIRGSQDALRDLLAAGHEVVICTAPCNTHCVAEKLEWLAEHFSFVDPKNVFVGHRKELIPADAFVDDSPRNASAYRAAHPDAFIVTIGQPYNRHLGAGPDCPGSPYDVIVEDVCDVPAWDALCETLGKYARRESL